MSAFKYSATRGLIVPPNAVGAWMVDDTEETIVGSELVTNGTFDADISSWDGSASAGSATVSWDAGGYIKLVAPTGSDVARARQVFTGLTIGKTYLLSFNCINRGTGGSVQLLDYSGGAKIPSIIVSSSGIDMVSFTAISTTLEFQIYASAVTGDVLFDDISLFIAVPDISGNEKALEVHGSITKLPVNTGSGAVAYSNFATGNYLRQPYNSDLDFGVGDWFYRGTFKTSPTTSNYIFSRIFYDGGLIGSVIALYVSASGYLRADISDDAMATFDFIQTVDVFDDNEFHSFVLYRSGNTVYLSVDDVIVGSVVLTNAVGSLSNVGASLYIGGGVWGAPFSTGSIMFVLPGNYAPTTTEIKQWYTSSQRLFEKYAPLQIVDNEYSLDLPLAGLSPNTKRKKAEREPIEGPSEVLLFNRNKTWQCQSVGVARTNPGLVEELEYAMETGQVVEFDPYGTVAVPDNPRSVQLQGDLATRRRGASQNFQHSFTVREV